MYRVKIDIELIPPYCAFIFAALPCFFFFLNKIYSYWFGIKEEYVEADEKEKNKCIEYKPDSDWVLVC